jgi:hypothetical protein
MSIWAWKERTPTDGEERNEDMNMDETIKNFQKDVQSHKDDNERLMKAKEQQDNFNMKLLEGLNIIDVRKTGPWSNKIKQMRKQNTEDTQYNRDTNLRGSPSVGYVHQRNC